MQQSPSLWEVCPKGKWKGGGRGFLCGLWRDGDTHSTETPLALR